MRSFDRTYQIGSKGISKYCRRYLICRQCIRSTERPALDSSLFLAHINDLVNIKPVKFVLYANDIIIIIRDLRKTRETSSCAIQQENIIPFPLVYDSQTTLLVIHNFRVMINNKLELEHNTRQKCKIQVPRNKHPKHIRSMKKTFLIALYHALN